jgi:hypothetical protein
MNGKKNIANYIAFWKGVEIESWINVIITIFLYFYRNYINAHGPKKLALCWWWVH